MIDKWRNYGLIGVIGGKGAKKAAKELVDVIGKAVKNPGRLGKQARLREIMHDDKVSSAWRGWLKQDANAMRRNSVARPGLRMPPGTNLAHKIGFEAAKGHGYKHADLQTVDLHKIQHKNDGMRKLNKDRGSK